MKIGNLHIKERDYTLIRNYLLQGIPILLEGPPGVGKSLAAKEIGRHVYNELASKRCPSVIEPTIWQQPLKIDITEDTEVRHLLGELDYLKLYNYSQSLAATGSNQTPEDRAALVEAFRREHCFLAGPLTQAALQGRLLIIEELDRAGRDTLFSALFDPIEKKCLYVPELGREISGHPDGRFNIIITVNRSTDVGTIRLPGALLRRLRRVVLYDPASDRDDPDGAISFEREIILANVDHLASNGILDRDTIDRPALTTQIDWFLRDFVRPLRMAELDAGALQSGISPSETTCWVLDILRIEGAEAFYSADRETLMYWLIEYRGAIAKDGNAAEKLDALLREVETSQQQAIKAAERQRHDRLRKAREQLQEKVNQLHRESETSSKLNSGDIEGHARLVQKNVQTLIRFIDKDLLPSLASDLGLPEYARQTDLPSFPASTRSSSDIIDFFVEFYAAIQKLKTELDPGGPIDTAATK